MPVGNWDMVSMRTILIIENFEFIIHQWELSFLECQTRCDFSGTDIGRYVRILRNKLDTIPRYSNSIITGPDVVAYKTKEQREYLENFFSEADVSLTAITWHP